MGRTAGIWPYVCLAPALAVFTLLEIVPALATSIFPIHTLEIVQGGRVIAATEEPLGARRLTLKSSQVAHVATSQRARWDTRRRMQLALTMLTESVLDVLITGESDFEELPETMAQIAEGPANTLCHRIRYPR